MLGFTARAAVLWGLAGLALSGAAWACRCLAPPLPQRFEEHRDIFTAQAHVLESGPGWQSVLLRTEEWFPGRSAASVMVYPKGLGGSCDQHFENGQRYLVYAWRREGRLVAVGNCGETQPLAKVEQSELRELRRLRARLQEAGRF